VTNLIVAKRYAKALLSIGLDDGSYTKYGEDLNSVAELIDSDKELRDAIASPLYAIAIRQNILSLILDKVAVASLVKNFFMLLLEKNRILLAKEISNIYKDLADQINNISRAKVKSAIELDDSSVLSIKKALEQVIGTQVEVELEVDPELIGGIVAVAGDLVLDGSIRTQLNRIQETLKRGEYI